MSEKTLRIGFVGAGAINFGLSRVPWDHASRLERIGGYEVIAIVDPDRKQAEHVLSTRKSSPSMGHYYKTCKLLKDARDLLEMRPDAVFIGIPPGFRGSPIDGKDVELQFVRSGINVFVEKPLSVIPPEKLRSYVESVTTACTSNNVVLSVGYMFRYHAAVLKMKELIHQHGGKVMAFNARYYHAYTSANNKYWYNSDFSGGPIVEQATHFCDLARFIVGDIDMASVRTILLNDADESGAGRLRHLSDQIEDDIPSEKRIPRVTMSHWKFENGGMGTLMHSIALPGTRYEANIDVQLDCLKLSLIEPYQKDCILRVRSLQNEDPNKDVDYKFLDDDCYYTELETFIKAVRSRDQSLIKSSYSDALKTYELTWTIRRAGKTTNE